MFNNWLAVVLDDGWAEDGWTGRSGFSAGTARPRAAMHAYIRRPAVR